MTIRELIIDWITASRYVKWLESRHYEQRQDFTERLSEKDARIKELRTEVVSLRLESDRMRLSVPANPMAVYAESQALKPPLVPAFYGPLNWDAELQRMVEEEIANGIPSERRVQEHESSPHEAA
jgi:hypothetical protein